MQFLAAERSLIMDALRGLCVFICQFVYTIMAWTWSLLMDVSKIRLLNSGKCTIEELTEKAICIANDGAWTDSTITLIYKRFTLLLGIIMTFYIIFQFIKYLINPEEVEDKEKGIEKLGFKLLTVVVLLAFVPTVFDYAYDFQSIVLDNQILSKIILGKQNLKGSEFGRSFSASLLSNFYYVEGQPYDELYDDEGNVVESGLECKSSGRDCSWNVVTTLTMFRQSGQLTGLDNGINDHGKIVINDSEEKNKYLIHFDGLFAMAVGIFITYMLIMYTIDVGARVIQLTFLQIIAPIPIITYLSPKKDGTFQKWAKQCGVTYLDLFIRLGILYFITLLIEAINIAYQNDSLLPKTGEYTSLPFFIYLVLILGLMMFCKRAPKMIEELFPSMGVASGSFGLKPGERVPESARRVAGAAISGAAGAAIGLGTGIAQGLRAGKRNGWAGFGRAIEGGIIGAAGGATRGLYNGSKKGNMVKNIGAGIKNQTAANRRFGNRAESGYKWRDQISDSARQAFNAPTRIEEIEKKKAPLKAKKAAYDNLAKSNDSIREHALKKAKDTGSSSYAKYAAAEGQYKRLQEDKDYINSFGGEQSDKYKEALSAASQDMKKYKDAAINDYIDEHTNRDAQGHVVADKNGNFYTDGKLDGLMKERNQNLENYNTYASKDNKIKGEKEKIKITKQDGTKEEKLIKDMTAWEYDEYIKKTANNEANKASRDISALEAEQQDIKDTTEGSGIPGGKK